LRAATPLVGLEKLMDGETKELIALDDGHRESTESWLDLLRGCKRRGMAALVLAVGDGALGFWSAVREVFPKTREQRCWWHKIGNVLNAPPKFAQPGAKEGARRDLERRGQGPHPSRGQRVRRRLRHQVVQGGRQDHRRPRRAAGLLRLPRRALDPPAHHQPIESTFATVRLRQRVTKGPGSRAAGVAMAFKLIESAQTRWRAVNAPHLVALVRAGAVFTNGKLIERPDGSKGGDQQVA
jgi:hypothetical protein